MKSVLMSKKNLIASLSITKFLGNQNKISWRWSYRFLRWKIPKLSSNHTCLAVISLDSTFKKDDNYYPQVFLKKRNYIGKKVVRHIMMTWVIFLLMMMSLMENKLEWIKFFVSQLPLNLTKFDRMTWQWIIVHLVIH